MSSRYLSISSLLLTFASSALGQVLIVSPRPGMPPVRPFEIPQMTLDASIREQVAQVQISQVFKNPGTATIDAEYLFPLPEEGAVQDLVLLVDGKELPGKVMAKDDARKIYEEIVRRQKDPALLEYMGRGLFKTSVFPIPGGQQRTITLKATFLCKRERDLVQFVYPLATQKHSEKPIGTLKITVRIESKAAIKNIYSPTHAVAIERNGDHAATIKLEQASVIPTGDFRVFYGLQDGQFGASVLSYKPDDREDGYFLLLASPSVKQDKTKPVAKTVVLTLDHSGSMSGKKIEQAREALKFVLNNLRDGDLFNIVIYDNNVESFKPELQRYSSSMREEAIRYVDNVAAGGSTNIDEALKTSLGMLKDDSRPNYVLFLTDGLPTTGETNEMAIANNAKAANKVNARIFAFGVGYDANARLLDRLSGGNSGVSEYVRPEDNLEEAVSRFYSRLSSPVLTKLAIAFEGSDVNQTYPKALPDLFEGGQLVWVGRYKTPGKAKVAISGKIGDEPYRLSIDADLASTASGGSHAFVERIWATRRVGTLIDELDLHGKNQELIDELVALSKKYGILTPYTSFLAEETTPLASSGELRRRAGVELEALKDVAGESGQQQRAMKQRYFDSGAAGAPPMALAQSSVRGGNHPGGVGGGFGGAAPASQPLTLAFDKLGRARAVNTVRQVGDKSFFRRDGRWVESTVTPEDEAKAIVVEQFSDDYFKLARAQSPDLNQYLTMPEEVTVRLATKVYRIKQAKN